MRTGFRVSLFCGLALALGVAGSARADTIALVWQGSGATTTSAVASFGLTADIVLTISSTDITSIGWNVSWDDELAYVTASTVGGSPGGGVPGTNWENYSLLDGPSSSTGTSPGSQSSWKYGVLGGTMDPATATVGTITFHVTNAVAFDGFPGTATAPGPAPGDVGPDMIDTTDGAGCFLAGGADFCTDRVTLGAASVHSIPVPEPGSVALLGLGLAGLGLVGLRSRR